MHVVLSLTMRSLVSFEKAGSFNVIPCTVPRLPESHTFTPDMHMSDSGRMGCPALGRPSHVIALVCDLGHIGTAHAW